MFGRLFDFFRSDKTSEPESTDWGTSINVTMAKDRMLEYFGRDIHPTELKATLDAALNGDLHFQQLLFNAMMDTWPRLQKAIDEVARMVAVAPWKIHPYVIRGEDPSSKAEQIAKDVETLIWSMRPDVVRGENSLEKTIKALVRGYYYGHQVLEIRWVNHTGKEWVPRATKTLPSRFYGYPSDIRDGDPEDRLMFDPQGATTGRRFIDFPEHRFLIAINKGHDGHASVAAPLRVLAEYWLAAVYGLKYFKNYTQLYGIPWRHAKVTDKGDQPKVAEAFKKYGSQGHIITGPGTVIDTIASSASGASLPQKVLLDLADQQCDQFILGQTLTGGTDKNGSRALGEVHEKTRDGMVDGVTDFVGEILSYQLVPAIVHLNWGEGVAEVPEMWAKREEAKDEGKLADRDEKLGITSGKVAVQKTWFYERHGIPMPADGDELLVDEEELAEREKATQEAIKPKEWDKPQNKPTDKVDASDATTFETEVDRLSSNVLEGLTGVKREWLAPVRPMFERLAALSMAKNVTEEDFDRAIEKAIRELPELFDHLNTEVLKKAFEEAIGTAAVSGIISRL